MSSDTKIVFCDPSFRGGSQSKERKVFADIGTIEFSRLRHALEEKFGGIWVVFVRLHPQLALKGISYNNTEDGVIDVTTIDDMYELLAATDAFVSDYSSAAFDASYMKIPVFLYVDDLDDYVADRGKLTWNIAEIPFSMAKNNDELENNILRFDNKEYIKRLDELFSSIKLLEDGKASKRIADYIDSKLNL